MSNRAKILADLYRRGKVSRAGLVKAVNDGVITPEEFEEIAGVGA